MDKKTKFPEEEGSVPEGGPSLRPTLFTEHRALRPRDSVSACESRPRGSSRAQSAQPRGGWGSETQKLVVSKVSQAVQVQGPWPL